ADASIPSAAPVVLREGHINPFFSGDTMPHLGVQHTRQLSDTGGEGGEGGDVDDLLHVVLLVIVREPIPAWGLGARLARPGQRGLRGSRSGRRNRHLATSTHTLAYRQSFSPYRQPPPGGFAIVQLRLRSPASSQRR